jgi:4-hydroxyproline epimerase
MQTMTKDRATSATNSRFARVHVVDSHTGGEPTRVIVAGGPTLPAGSARQKLEHLRQNSGHFRTSTINEPRGSDIMVGALLCEPQDKNSAAGVIYFNNVGYLGMCVHGTIGIVVTLAYLRRIRTGTHLIESPVGTVSATLHESGEVTVENVSSYRSQANLAINVPGYGKIHGDVAWGGNWFFLVNHSPIELLAENVNDLADFTWAIRQALDRNKITGPEGQEIDHVELFAESKIPGVDSKNFVLCPGKAYDRSPCGTGTSAKLACLYADGKLRPGQVWRQESIVGSIFKEVFSSKTERFCPVSRARPSLRRKRT